MITLKGITCDYTLGLIPMVATAKRIEKINSNVTIIGKKRSPQAFAYANANGNKPNYAHKAQKFADTVNLYGNDRLTTTLGGTGNAVSANSQHEDIAANNTAFVTNPEMQANFLIELGAQSGHKDTWQRESTSQILNNYFTDTLLARERGAVLHSLNYGRMSNGVSL